MRAVLGLRRAVSRWLDARLPPDVVVLERTTASAIASLLGVVARFGVVDALGQERRSARALAEQLSLDADRLHRALRALALNGFFTLHPDGTVENNRLSWALRAGGVERSREWVLYWTSESNQRAWTNAWRTVQSGTDAFELAHGMTVWQWFEAHPDEREIFAHAMMGLTHRDAPIIAGLFPFGEVVKLCDVGGGRGALLAELLARYPHLSGVLCDAPGVVESAKGVLEARGVAGRVALAPGDFFQKVPGGCDTYLMKNILHDWDDATAVRVLSVVRAAMQAGQRLLLCEALIEPNAADDVAALSDVQMMIVCQNGRERSLAELQQLLSSARFTPARVFRSETIAVLEALAT